MQLTSLKKKDHVLELMKGQEIYDSIGEKLAVILDDLHSILVYYRSQYPRAKFQPTGTTIGFSIYKTVLKNNGLKNCPNDRTFYFIHYSVNSYPNHTISLLVKSQEAIILYTIVSDYYRNHQILGQFFNPLYLDISLLLQLVFKVIEKKLEIIKSDEGHKAVFWISVMQGWVGGIWEQGKDNGLESLAAWESELETFIVLKLRHYVLSADPLLLDSVLCDPFKHVCSF